MISVVLTLDYELFGNGLGDVEIDIIAPTDRLINICNKYGAKVTLMFEIGEYWAFKRREKTERLTAKDAPSYLMEYQARRAIQQGHDVQLHLHPQWIGAKLVNDQWQLNFDYLMLANLPDGVGDIDNVYSVTGALHKGKKDLEEMLRSVKPHYSCVAFRAGYYCAQPSELIIRCMKKAGLLADTSVIKGDYSNGSRVFDYRQAHSNIGYWWTTAQDHCIKGVVGENIIELPICSELVHGYTLLTPTRINNYLLTRKRRKSISVMSGDHKNISKEDRSILQKCMQLHPKKMDFCKLSSGELVRLFKKSSSIATNEEAPVPIVLIGHSKDFFDGRSLDTFLSFLCSKYRGKVEFLTLSEVVESIVNHSKQI